MLLFVGCSWAAEAKRSGRSRIRFTVSPGRLQGINMWARFLSTGLSLRAFVGKPQSDILLVFFFLKA